MTEEARRWMSQLGLSVSLGVGAALLSAAPAWSQEPTSPAPAPAAEAADQAADNATDAAAETAQDATEQPAAAAREATQDAREAAQPARESAAPAADATRDAAQNARDSARDAVDSARDAARSTRDAAQNTRDAARNAVDAAGDADRNTRDRTRTSARAAIGGAADQEFRVEDTRAADIGLWFDNAARASVAGQATPGQAAAQSGLVISDVATTGAITRLGFREGDRIVSVNGQPIAREADFINYLFADDIRDQQVRVIVNRAGREEVIMVQPAALVREITTIQHSPLEELGIILDDRYDDKALVWRVTRRSPAYYGGVRSGDVITALNDQRVQTPEDLQRAVVKFEGEPLQFEVNRGERVRQVSVEVQQAAIPAPREQLEYNEPLPQAVPPAQALPPADGRPGLAPAPRNVDPTPDRPGVRPLLPRRRD